MLFLRTVLSALVICLYAGNLQLTSAYRNFYWREWNGTVPRDAVAGGVVNGQLTYIGSSLLLENNGSFISTITKNSKVASTNFGNTLYTTELLKTEILCADDDSQPIWKSVHLDTMFTPECKFIKAGYYNGDYMYVGRKQVRDNEFIGRVYPTTHGWSGFEYWNNGQFSRIKEFEILAYCDGIN